jgi:hypothetical protein
MGYRCGYARQLDLGGYIDKLKTFRDIAKFWVNTEYDVGGSFVEVIKSYF